MVRTNAFENGRPAGNCLTKNEILRGKKQFERLIREGKTVRTGNILCHYKTQPIPENQSRALRAGFSVSRRGMRKAIDRNRVKRLMREAYRLNKQMLSELIHNNNFTLDLLFIYRGNISKKPRHLKFDDVQHEMIRCLNLIGSRIAGRENT